MCLFFKRLKEDEKIYKKLSDECSILSEKAGCEEAYEKKSREFFDFIENQYSLHMYEKYSAKKPKLIEVKTGKVISWEEGFGTSFDKISKSLRHSLVGLKDGSGRYKIK